MRKCNKRIGYIIIILIVIFFFLIIKLINKKVRPLVLSVAQDECKRVSDILINNSVRKEISNGLSFDKLFITTYSNDKVSSIDFDTIVVNRVITNITNDILLNLKYIESGDIDNIDYLNLYDKNKLKKGIIYEIPITLSYNNTFISNLSPKVPVRLQSIGNINSSINTKVTNYGINNALIEVYLDVEINLQVVLPLLTKSIVTKSSVPLAIKMVSGNVPQFFSNGNQSFSVPIN